MRGSSLCPLGCGGPDYGHNVRSSLEFDSQPAASYLLLQAIDAVVGGNGVHDARRPASLPVRVKVLRFGS